VASLLVNRLSKPAGVKGLNGRGIWRLMMGESSLTSNSRYETLEWIFRERGLPLSRESAGCLADDSALELTSRSADLDAAGPSTMSTWSPSSPGSKGLDCCDGESCAWLESSSELYLRGEFVACGERGTLEGKSSILSLIFELVGLRAMNTFWSAKAIAAEDSMEEVKEAACGKHRDDLSAVVSK